MNVALKGSIICSGGNYNVSSRWSNGGVDYIAIQENSGAKV
jgi:hypothetical protein